nr:hypothetical protein [Microbacterium bovistercoris]
MALEPFATPQQMADRSQGAITATTHPFLDSALKAASKKIRDYCRWHIAENQPLTYKRSAPSTADVWLPAMQITEITSVIIDGTTWDQAAVDAVEFDPDTGWTNLRGRLIEVGYTAGYTEMPEDLVDLTLMIASRALGSPLGAVREQTLVSSITWSQAGVNVAGGTVLLAHEKTDLDDTYRIGLLP